MTTKVCSTCKEEKCLDYFHLSKNGKHGRQYECKECTKIKSRNRYIREKDIQDERVRKWRDNNREKTNKYVANYRQNKPEKAKELLDSWKNKFPAKARAISKANKAVTSGKIIKQNKCENCKSKNKIHKHHDDYSKPLIVRWLCGMCHKEWHRLNGEGLNGVNGLGEKPYGLNKQH